jgi:hypothetical protein
MTERDGLKWDMVAEAEKTNERIRCAYHNVFEKEYDPSTGTIPVWLPMEFPRKDAYVTKFVLEAFDNLFFCLSRFIGVDIRSRQTLTHSCVVLGPPIREPAAAQSDNSQRVPKSSNFLHTRLGLPLLQTAGGPRYHGMVQGGISGLGLVTTRPTAAALQKTTRIPNPLRGNLQTKNPSRITAPSRHSSCSPLPFSYPPICLDANFYLVTTISEARLAARLPPEEQENLVW